MNCKKCDKEVFAKETKKEGQPQAFMAYKPEGSDDVRCVDHKSQ